MASLAVAARSCSPSLRVPVHQLMARLKSDDELQNALDAPAWADIDALHEAYDLRQLDRRGLVDGLVDIVGKQKLLMVLKLALAQRSGRHPSTANPKALRHISSNSSLSTGSPGTPAEHAVGDLSDPQPRGGRVAAPQRSSTKPPQEVCHLVHSFHCNDPYCAEPKCPALREVIQRLETHVDQNACGTRVIGPSGGCKACKLWWALVKTCPLEPDCCEPASDD